MLKVFYFILNYSLYEILTKFIYFILLNFILNFFNIKFTFFYFISNLFNHLCKFWFGKIKGFGIYGGQILGSPIEMAGHLYNSAALPRSL